MSSVRTGSIAIGLKTPGSVRHAAHGNLADAGTDIGSEDADCAFSSEPLDSDRDRVVAHGSDSRSGPDILPPAVSMTASGRNSHLCLASDDLTSG